MTSSDQTRSTGSSSDFPFSLGCQEASYNGEVSGAAPGFLLALQHSASFLLFSCSLCSLTVHFQLRTTRFFTFDSRRCI